MDHHYDAIVVGGRSAGAATAMLLARGGMRVLVVEAAGRAPTPCPPMRSCAACAAAAPWGSARRGRRRGHTGHSFDRFATATTKSRPSTSVRAAAYRRCTPRRTVLDPLLLEAARVAGAEVRIPRG